MKQIQIFMSLLLVVAFSANQQAYSQGNKPVTKDKIEKQERILKKEVKEEKKEMKEEMQEKREEMKNVKEAHKDEIKEIKQEHKDKIDAMKDHNDDDGNVRNDRDGKVKPKDKSNNGNAYGKNKEGLTGREFGQARAAEARAQINNREMELQTAEVKIINSRKRLQDLVQRFEKSREANEITEEEYALRKQKIEDAENKLKKVVQSFEKNKEVVDLQKKRLSTIFENE